VVKFGPALLRDVAEPNVAVRNQGFATIIAEMMGGASQGDGVGFIVDQSASLCERDRWFCNWSGRGGKTEGWN
jgi:hypothetical protein